MTFRDRLRAEIEYKGMSIKEIALETGINNNTILSYIDARGYLPNVETAVKLANALGVSVEYLATGKYSSIKDKDTEELIQIFSKLSKDNKKLLIKIAMLLN